MSENADRDHGSKPVRKNRLGSMLVWLLIAAVLFVVLFAVLRLASWVVRNTFPAEELSRLDSTQAVLYRDADSELHPLLLAAGPCSS